MNEETDLTVPEQNKPWQFQPGHSGNPAGRPKGRFSLTSRMIKRLEEKPEETEAILDWLIANRKDLIWNKIDPNPPGELNLGGTATPIILQIIKDGDNKAV